MIKIKNVTLLLCFITLWGCNGTSEKQNTSSIQKDSTVFSFTFMGCNRIDWSDVSDSVPSTANKGVLKRIFKEMAALKDKPSLFFFLGDLVLAETDTSILKTQLAAWVKLYENDPFSKSGIELVAVPGNHEMLYSKKVKLPDGTEKYKEYPLEYATDIWYEHMSGFMPKTRQHVEGSDSINNRLTFSFVRDQVGFIVMNTDTYNSPTKEKPLGFEGKIPTDWILNKIKAFKADEKINHIFVLGHKPYYVSGIPETGHKGLPEGPVLWTAMNEGGVTAMLSAHVHDYQRMQPNGKGTYQVIAGNAGSKGEATFFGYSTIEIKSSGKVKLISRGFDVGNHYNVVSGGPSTIRDSTTLTMSANVNPYKP